MPSAIRNRLRKRQASPDLLHTAASDAEDSCASSARSSHESIRPVLTPTSMAIVPTKEDDLGDIPPPPPPKSAEKQKAREFSPPQTLLDRYRKRSVYTTAVHAQRVPSGGRNEHVVVEHPPSKERSPVSLFPAMSPEVHMSLQDQTTQTDTRTFSGVQFDMVSNRRAGVPPKPIGPEAESEPRRTRSQTRMQRRVDSLGSDTDVQDFATSSDKRGSSVPPRSTSHGRRANPQDFERALHPDPKQLSNTNPSLMPIPLNTSTIKPVVPSPSSAGSSDRSQPDPLLSPLPKSLAHNRRNSNSNHITQFTNKKEDEITISPIVVNPPNHLLDPSALHLWTSDLSFNSRPYVPWELSKRWTCCQCAQQDPTRRAAQTIVEQKVCSRLECRHERCPGGCRVAPNMGFVGLQ